MRMKFSVVPLDPASKRPAKRLPNLVAFYPAGAVTSAIQLPIPLLR